MVSGWVRRAQDDQPRGHREVGPCPCIFLTDGAGPVCFGRRSRDGADCLDANFTEL